MHDILGPRKHAATEAERIALAQEITRLLPQCDETQLAWLWNLVVGWTDLCSEDTRYKLGACIRRIEAATQALRDEQ